MTIDDVLPVDGPAWLHRSAIPDADRLLRVLETEVAWRQEEARVMGRQVLIPRLTAWYGDAGYVYSGIRLHPAPWSPPLVELKTVADRLAGCAFNSVLLNLYRSGRDSVSWHSDDEPGLGPEPVIASLSLGAARRFQFKHRKGGELVTIELEHGSALIMAGRTQSCWRHQVPKTARAVGPRINLTFRLMHSA